MYIYTIISGIFICLYLPTIIRSVFRCSESKCRACGTWASGSPTFRLRRLFSTRVSECGCLFCGCATSSASCNLPLASRLLHFQSIWAFKPGQTCAFVFTPTNNNNKTHRMLQRCFKKSVSLRQWNKKWPKLVTV